MNKVIVIGSGGAGKSVLARRLGQLINLPVIHLDALNWNPGWIETPKDIWKQKIEELVSADEWIIDGNYGGTLDVRLKAADTVIYLDFPPLICLLRVFKRRIMYHKRIRSDVGPGCPERLNWDFIKWIWNFRKIRSGVYLAKLRACSSTTSYILRRPKDVSLFLRRIAKDNT